MHFICGAINFPGLMNLIQPMIISSAPSLVVYNEMKLHFNGSLCNCHTEWCS